MLTGSFETHIHSCDPKANINKAGEGKAVLKEEDGGVGKSVLQQKCKHSCTGEHNLSTEKKWVFSVSFSRKGSRRVLLAWNKHIRAKLNSKLAEMQVQNP